MGGGWVVKLTCNKPYQGRGIETLETPHGCNFLGSENHLNKGNDESLWLNLSQTDFFLPCFAKIKF